MKSLVVLLALVFVTAVFADPSHMLVPQRDRVEYDIDDEEVKDIISEYCAEFPDYHQCMAYFLEEDKDKSLPRFLAELIASYALTKSAEELWRQYWDLDDYEMKTRFAAKYNETKRRLRAVDERRRHERIERDRRWERLRDETEGMARAGTLV
jgi:hypothetical protein